MEVDLRMKEEDGVGLRVDAGRGISGGQMEADGMGLDSRGGVDSDLGEILASLEGSGGYLNWVREGLGR